MARHSDPVIEPGIFVEDDLILEKYLEKKKNPPPAKDIVEVWELFKEFVSIKLKTSQTKRYALGSFATLQKQPIKLSSSDLFMDLDALAFIMNCTTRSETAGFVRERFYDKTYEGKSKQEIEDTANEN